jgi:hypothetical protein
MGGKTSAVPLFSDADNRNDAASMRRRMIAHRSSQ